MKSTKTQLSSGTVRRRALLSSLGLAATSGCVRRLQSIAGRDPPTRLSLSIKTVPADADPRATRIARMLSTNLSQVGIDAEVVPMSREELFRDVLLNHQFDLYIAQHPGHRDTGFLRSLVHSEFDFEPGWQNPFGYTDLDLDDRLERLPRLTGGSRSKALTAALRNLVRNQPFSVVGFPEEIRVTREDNFENWSSEGIHSLSSYLSVTPTGDTLARETATPSTSGSATPNGPASTASVHLAAPSNDSTPTGEVVTASPARAETSTTSRPTPTATATPTETASSPTELRMTLTDSRPTENLNPLAVEFRGPAGITSLLYDSLARPIGGEPVPWLASTWEWDTSGAAQTLEVTLRDDLHWHDGEKLTASDVAFTYRFLADTSLESLSTPVPAPRFRARSSLIDEVEQLDVSRVRIRFSSVSKARAQWVLTVPVLPKHVWEQRTEAASIPWLRKSETVTKALVWQNPTPVGSGPFQFRSSTVKESMVLEPFTDHFLTTEDLTGAAARFEGGPSVDRLTFTVVPSTGAAVELLRQGDADATASPLLPEDVPAIGRDDRLDLSVRPSREFYHVGYNVRRSPLSNPRFRRSVARLLDKSFIVDSVFEGYARPAVTPLTRTEAPAEAPRWGDGDEPLAFAGTNGSLDVEAAREHFRQTGYRYVDGRLVVT